MRKEFRGFYPPTDDELERLWQGDVILDANVLLNFYRYGPATVSNLFNVLEALKAQLWLPHQAAAEFHRNRIAVMSAQPKAYEELDKTIKDLRNRLVAAIRGKSRHPEIDAGRLEEVATAAIDSVEKELNTQLQASSPPNPADLSMDPILERITRLFSTGVGSAFTENELATLRREADVRYKESIPPGYRDASKEGDRRYGDFIIWSEIIRRAQNEQRPVLFITDDLKEDWWQRSSGHTLGPQPALVQEIWERSNQLFYMYDPRKFIDEASRRLSITIDSSTLGEVSQVSKEGEYADRVSELERMEDEHTVRRLLRSEQTERSILHAQHVLDLERKKRALDKRISTLHAGLFDVDDATEFGALRGEMSRLSLFEKQTDLDVALMESERLRAEIEQARSAHLRAEREEEESEVIRRELRRLHERRVRSVDESSQ